MRIHHCYDVVFSEIHILDPKGGALLNVFEIHQSGGMIFGQLGCVAMCLFSILSLNIDYENSPNHGDMH